MPASIRSHWVPAVSLLDPVMDDPLVAQQIDPPPPLEVAGEEEYQGCNVEDSRKYRNQLQYLI